MKHSLAVGIIIVVVVAVSIAIFGYVRAPIFADEPAHIQSAVFASDARQMADEWNARKQPLLDAISAHTTDTALEQVTALQQTFLALRVDASQTGAHLARVLATDALKATLEKGDFATALDDFEKLSRAMPSL